MIHERGGNIVWNLPARTYKRKISYNCTAAWSSGFSSPGESCEPRNQALRALTKMNLWPSFHQILQF